VKIGGLPIGGILPMEFFVQIFCDRAESRR
jgi:hypothetical protein